MSDRNCVSSVFDAWSDMLVNHVWVMWLFGIWCKFLTKVLVDIRNVRYRRRSLAEVPLYHYMWNVYINVYWYYAICWQTTVIVERMYPPKLAKIGKKPSLQARNKVLKFVCRVHDEKTADISCILTDFVEGNYFQLLQYFNS